MSLEYTSKGPSTVGFSGQVVNPEGPLESDFTPIVTSDALVFGETISIHFATRTLFIADNLTTHEAASRDVTPITFTQPISVTERLALAVRDVLTFNEAIQIGPGIIGSSVFVQPFYPKTSGVGSGVYALVVYPKTGGIGSTIFFMPHFPKGDAVGSALYFKANLPRAIFHDTLTFTETVQRYLAPRDILNVQDKVQRVWNLSVTDPISIVVDEVSAGPLVHQSINVVETIGRVFEATFTDSLSFVERLIIPVTDHLTFTERFAFVRSVLDHLTFVEVTDVRPSLVDNLHFSEVLALAVVDTPLLMDQINRIFSASFSDFITFFVEGFTGPGVIKPGGESLVINESIVPSNTYNRTFTDNLSIQDGVVRIQSTNPGITGVCEEGYVPVIPLGTRTGVVLTWPYVAPSLVLNLRNPKFGNQDTTNTNTRYSRTRAGELHVFRGANWPTIETLKVQFEGLTEQQKDDFEDFITQSAALEIGYLDQENRQWRGFITNPSLETVQVGIGCQYNLGFELRGRLA